MAMKVTARTRAEELRRSLRRVDQSWTGDEQRNLLEIFVRLLPRSFRAERCGIFAVEAETGRIVSKTGTHLAEGEIIAPHKQSIVGQVIASGAATVARELDAAPGFHKAVEIATGFRTRSILCVPVRRAEDGAVIGAIEIVNRRDGVFDEEDVALLEQVARFLAQAIERERLTQELRTVSRRLERDLSLHSCLCEDDDFLARSAAMRTVLENTRAIAELPVNVLILGENGTGKERIARLLHDHSRRSEGPFVPVNCASIPEALVESELFGYERGAFTGADRARGGRLEEAEKGTLFLDEIGDLPMVVQPKLLRVLQEGRGRRLGGEGLRRYDFRIVCATNRDLRGMVAAGSFREDLYYRLFSVEVKLPPLRQRGEDIMALAHGFLETTCRRFGKRVDGFSDGVVELFEGYRWPGNVRQLRNEVERLVVFTPDGERARVAACSAELQGAAGHPRVTRPGLAVSLPDQVRCLERDMILEALEKSGGNKERAARALGISRQGLYKKLARYGIS